MPLLILWSRATISRLLRRWLQTGVLVFAWRKTPLSVDHLTTRYQDLYVYYVTNTAQSFTLLDWSSGQRAGSVPFRVRGSYLIIYVDWTVVLILIINYPSSLTPHTITIQFTSPLYLHPICVILYLYLCFYSNSLHTCIIYCKWISAHTNNNSFITEIYIVPLKGYLEALTTLAWLKIRVLKQE